MEAERKSGGGCFLAGVLVGFLLGFALDDKEKRKLLGFLKEALAPLLEEKGSPSGGGDKKSREEKKDKERKTPKRRFFVAKLRSRLSSADSYS